MTVTDAQGVERKLRRLVYDDLYALAEVLREALGRGQAALGSRLRGLQPSAQTYAAAFLMGSPATRLRLAEWLADVVGCSVEDLRDPERFPLGTLANLFRALASHPDVSAFFFALLGETLGERMLEAWTRTATRTLSGWLSTSSSPDTEAPATTG